MRKSMWVLVAVLAGLAAFGGIAFAQQDGPVSVDMSFDGAPIADVLRVLGELGRYNVMIDEDVQGSVSFRLEGMTVDDAIDLVVRSSGYSYRTIGRTLIVGKEASLRERFDTIEARIIPLQYADPQNLAGVIRLLVPNIEIQVDPTQRALVVRGRASELDRVAQLAKERDVRPSVNREFVNTPILNIFRTLAELGGYNLVAAGPIDGSMTIFLRVETPEEAIALVGRRSGIEFEIDGTDLILTSPKPVVSETATAVTTPSAPEVPAEPMVQEFIQLAYINPDRIVDAVQLIIGDGSVWVDGGTRTIILSATAGALERVKALVAAMDVPQVQLQGILRQGDDYTAILQIEGQSYVARVGTTVGSVRVVQITSDEVVLATVHGQEFRVAAGRQ